VWTANVAAQAGCPLVTVHAASYPQIVALTRLLVSLFWCTAAYQDWPESVEFLSELRRTVAPDYHWTIHRS
jgi:hypothetical protein